MSRIDKSIYREKRLVVVRGWQWECKVQMGRRDFLGVIQSSKVGFGNDYKTLHCK